MGCFGGRSGGAANPRRWPPQLQPWAIGRIVPSNVSSVLMRGRCGAPCWQCCGTWPALGAIRAESLIIVSPAIIGTCRARRSATRPRPRRCRVATISSCRLTVMSDEPTMNAIRSPMRGSSARPRARSSRARRKTRWSLTGGRPIGCGMAASQLSDFLPASRMMRVGGRAARHGGEQRQRVGEVGMELVRDSTRSEKIPPPICTSVTPGWRDAPGEGAGAAAAHDLDSVPRRAAGLGTRRQQGDRRHHRALLQSRIGNGHGLALPAHQCRASARPGDVPRSPRQAPPPPPPARRLPASCRYRPR